MERKMHTLKTGFGNVMLTPTDEKHIYVSTDKQLADAHSIRVNGVAYHLGAHIYLWPDGVWWFGSPPPEGKTYSEDAYREPYMSRMDCFRNGKYDSEPSRIAKDKVRTDLARLVNEWVTEHPKEMAEAELKNLVEKCERKCEELDGALKRVEELRREMVDLDLKRVSAMFMKTNRVDVRTGIVRRVAIRMMRR